MRNCAIFGISDTPFYARQFLLQVITCSHCSWLVSCQVIRFSSLFIIMFFRVLFLLAFLYSASACSNIVVSPGASADASSMVSYNADSASLFGCLYHYPAATHASGSMRDVYEWDTGVYLGKIKEAEVTYNVVGNMNEHGLVIGETTYGGLEELQHQKKALIDYGSYIWITLQRSKNARDAIETLSSLFKEYGWYSEGESFSIADPNEAW